MTSPRDVSPIAINKGFVLASASPRRVALLAQIGYAPRAICPAALDEVVLKGELPRNLAMRLAKSKAALIAATSDEPVLAADTVVARGRRILPKAEDEATARQCLELLSGAAHRVYTGVCLIQGDAVHQRLVETRLRFKRLSQADMAAYLASGEWQGKAGGYAIQGRAASFVQNLSGSYSNVVGLPLFETAQLLQGAGLCPEGLGEES